MMGCIDLTSCLYTHDNDDGDDDDEEEDLECGEVRQKVGSCARKVRSHCP